MENKKQDKGKARKRPKSPGATRSQKKAANGQQQQTLKEEVKGASQTITLSSEDNQEKSKEQRHAGLIFKNPKYRETGFATRTKTWKNLKQIMTSQKSQSSPEEVMYVSIDAPPSTKPVKKYSDVSGLPALYTDPHTKLRYSDSDEYRRIQHMSSDTVIGLLTLRQAQYV